MPVPRSTAAALIGWAATGDNREPTEAAIAMWSEALDDHVTLGDGKTAITRHFATSDDYLKPIHINAGVRAIRRNRTDRIGADEIPPADLDMYPARALAWTREYRRAIGDGEEPQAAQKRACDAVGIDVPLQLDPVPRSEEIKRLMAAPKRQCECQPPCMEAHVRPEEGAP